MHLLNESNLWQKIMGKYKSYSYLKLIINGLYLLRRYSLWNKIHVKKQYLQLISTDMSLTH